jgi:hypothetical protein
MTERTAFIERVRKNASDTPYVVEETDKGFDLRIDLADARWYGVLTKSGLKRTFVFHVELEEDSRIYRVTDDSYELEWTVGAVGPVPVLGAKLEVERELGRKHEFEFKKTYALDERGRPGAVVDYKFSSGEGRQLITDAASGWTERRGTAEGIARFVAFGTGALVVLLLIVLAVIFLLG